jgi:hypothetical protein
MTSTPRDQPPGATPTASDSDRPGQAAEGAAPVPRARAPIRTVGYHSRTWHVYQGVDGDETHGDPVGPAFATYEEATTYARDLDSREYRQD